MPRADSIRKLDTLPALPGVYIFYGAQRRVLYIGKASNLRSRVRSYFQSAGSDTRAFISKLAAELVDLETFITESDREAALLENQLIKSHQPVYNYKLRDDKEFLSITLNPNEPWPRLRVARRPKRSQKKMDEENTQRSVKKRRASAGETLSFGPYHSATAARNQLRIVNRNFLLRTCTESDFKARTRPCLQFQINRCLAPCVFDVDPQVYRTEVDNAVLFLRGDRRALKENIESKMKKHSAAQEYEVAARFRDQLNALALIGETQRVSADNKADQDVIGLFRRADQAQVAVLRIRKGRLSQVETFAISNIALEDGELVERFLADYYGYADVPREIFVPALVGDCDQLGAVINAVVAERDQLLDRVVKIQIPQRGAKKQLIEMAAQNAAHAFAEQARAQEDVEQRLKRVQDRLRLDAFPSRIECIDISHSQGTDTVAAVVALVNGAPARQLYRTFHVRRAKKSDDYGAIYEALSRRFRRGLEALAGKGDSTWQLPDLLVVDGGKGQLASAIAAAKDVGVELDIVGLAKERKNMLETGAADKDVVDRIYLRGQANPIAVRSDAALRLLTLARDEAHRFANRGRKQIGKRRQFQSPLDLVPGVGIKTRTKLLKAFDSIAAMTAADDNALIAAGATRKQVAAIRKTLGASSEAQPRSQEVNQVINAALDNAFE